MTTLIFGALTVDCIELQPLTVNYKAIYGSIQKSAHNSTPSLVYVLTMLRCSCDC